MKEQGLFFELSRNQIYVDNQMKAYKLEIFLLFWLGWANAY